MHNLRLLFSLVALLWGSTAFGQGSEWNMQLAGLPPQPSPFFSDVEDMLQNGQVLWSLNYFGAEDAVVYLHFVIVSDRMDISGVPVPFGDEVLDRVIAQYGFDGGNFLAFGTSGALPIPPGPYTDVQPPRDLIDVYPFTLDFSENELASVVLTNRIPEGQYAFYYWLTTEPRGAGEVLADAFSGFFASYPDRPQLLIPEEDADVSEQYPIFSWEPLVVGGNQRVIYRFVLKELFRNQNPEEAIRTNVVHYEAFLENRVVLNYPVDALELTPGSAYVWRIEALDENEEPLMEEYVSEAFVFTRRQQETGGAIAVNTVAPASGTTAATPEVDFLFMLQPGYDTGGLGAGTFEWLNAEIEWVALTDESVDPTDWFDALSDEAVFEGRVRQDPAAMRFPVILSPGPMQRTRLEALTVIPNTEAIAWRIVATSLAGERYASVPTLLLRQATPPRPPVLAVRQAPRLIAPAEQSVTADGRPIFEWEPGIMDNGQPVPQHHVVLSICSGQAPSAADCEEVFEITTNQTRFRYPQGAPALHYGMQYQWYVESQDAQDQPLAYLNPDDARGMFWAGEREARLELLTPVAGVILQENKPTLEWTPVGHPDPGSDQLLGYRVSVRACPANGVCDAPILDQTQYATKDNPATSYVYDGEPLQPGQRYVWRVEAMYDEQTIAQGDSEFRYLTASVAPVLTGPSRDVVVESEAVDFAWIGVDWPGQDIVYTLQLLTCPEEGACTPEQHASMRYGLEATEYSVKDLEVGRRYGWYVSAERRNGELLAANSVSETRFFRYLPVNQGSVAFIPRLVAPSLDGLVGRRGQVLRWRPVDVDPSHPKSKDPVRYRVLLWKCDLSGACDEEVASVITDFTEHAIDDLPLESGRMYAWRVESIDAQQELRRPFAHSEVFRFRYRPDFFLTVVPQLVAPAANALVEVGPATLQWKLPRLPEVGYSFDLHVLDCPATGMCTPEEHTSRTYRIINSDKQRAYERVIEDLEPGRNYGWYVEVIGNNNQPLTPQSVSAVNFFRYLPANQGRISYIPRVIAPLYNSTVERTGQALRWTPVNIDPSHPKSKDPVQYRVHVWGGCDKNFSCEAEIAQVTTPHLGYPLDELPLLPGARYAWWVESIDAQGELRRPGAFSERSGFTYAPNPELALVPTLVSPAPNTVATDEPLRLTWEAVEPPKKINDALYYDVVLFECALIALTCDEEMGRFSTSKTHIDLEPELFVDGRFYAWQVEVIDGTDRYSADSISERARFQYRPGAGSVLAFQLESPAEGATVTDELPVFSWRSVEPPKPDPDVLVGYRFALEPRLLGGIAGPTLKEWSGFATQDDPANTLAYALDDPALEPGLLYTWRVDVVYNDEVIAQDEATFVYQPNPRAALVPRLLTPIADAVEAQEKPVFEWEALQPPADLKVLFYRLVVKDCGEDPATCEVPFFETVLQDTRTTPEVAFEDGQYYQWYVEVLNDGKRYSAGSVSARATFQYQPGASSITTFRLVAPSNNSTVQTELPVFEWTPIDLGPGDVLLGYRFALYPQILAGLRGPALREWQGFVTKDDPANTLAYTLNDPALQTGQSYTWSVDVMYDNRVLASRTASFTYQPEGVVAYVPQLVAPENLSVVNDAKPTLSWEVPAIANRPANAGPVFYRVTLSECPLLGDACVSVSSNVTSETSVALGADALTDGAVYEWQVEVLNNGERYSRGSVSEARRFQYAPQAERAQKGDLPERIALFEDVVYVDGFGEEVVVERRVEDNAPVVSGPAELVVKAGGEEARVPVMMNEVVLDPEEPSQPQGGSIWGDTFDRWRDVVNPPVQQGGGVSGEDEVQALNLDRDGGQVGQQGQGLRSENDPWRRLGNDVFEIRQVTWAQDAGVLVDGIVHLPGDIALESEEPLRLGQNGLQGRLVLQDEQGQPLYAVGDDAVRFEARRVDVAFPSGNVTVDGDLKFAASEAGCTVNGLAVIDGDMEGQIRCEPEAALALGEDIGIAAMLQTVEGTIRMAADGTFSYDLSANAMLAAAWGNNAVCEMGVALQIADGQIILDQVTESCPRVSLVVPLGGGMELRLFELGLTELAYRNEAWQFAIETDVEWFVPGYALPRLDAVVLSHEGLRIPAFALDRDVFANFEPLGVGPFALRLVGFAADELMLPWAEFGQPEDGPDVRLAFELQSPECLNTAVGIEDVALTENGWQGTIPATIIEDPGCPIPLGPVATLNLRSVGGTVHIDTDAPSLAQGTRLNVRGDLTVHDPFTCGEETALALGDTDLTVLGGGFVEGVVADWASDCPLDLGIGETRITSSTLTFGVHEDEQTAILDAEAALRLGNTDVAGTVRFNLVTGEWEAVRFETQQPFTLAYPEEEPILAFTINRAVLTLDGLVIDGRHTVDIGGESVGVTFDEVSLDPRTRNVQLGAIYFDQSFALEMAINEETGALAYQVVPYEHELVASPAALVGLAGRLFIDREGLRAMGEGRAAIRYAGLYYGELRARYSDDFALSLDPFNVRAGRITLFYEEDRAGVIDASGFHPDPLFFGTGIIPELLPLPSLEVAYLRLRTPEGNLLIEPVRRERLLCFSTPLDEPMDFILPALDPVNPPRAEVVFEDVCVDAVTLELVSGFIQGTPPAGDPAFNLAQRGIPLAIQSVTAQVLEDEGVNVLGLDGHLVLFGHDLGQNSRVAAYVYSDGQLQVDLELNDLGATVPLAGADAQFVMELDALSGRLDLPMSQPELGMYDLDADGTLELRDNDGRLGANIGGVYTPRGFTLDRFEPYGDIEPLTIELGDGSEFVIHDFDWRTFRYTDNRGFDFRFALDFDLTLDYGDSDPFTFALDGIEFVPSGFTFPRLDLNWDWESDEAGFDLRGFRLQPLRFALEPFTFNWFEWEAGDDTGFNPSFDLTLYLPDFGALSPPDGITLRGFRFADGLFLGSVESYRFPGWPTFGFGSGGFDWTPGQGSPYEPWSFDEGDWRWPFSLSDLNLRFFDDDGSQGIDFRLRGRFFENIEGCNPTDATLQLGTSGLQGQVAGLHPCQPVEIGPVTLTFEESTVDFAVVEQSQDANWTGTAVLRAPGPNNTTVAARGNIAMNLLSGAVTDGFVELAEPFLWPYPTTEEPLFTLEMNQLRYDADGFLIDGEGALQNGALEAAVRAETLQLAAADGAIQDGRLVIDAPIGLRLDLGEGLALVPADAPKIGDNTLWLTLPDEAAFIDAQGLNIRGEAQAVLHVARQQMVDLSARFSPDFRMQIDPFDVLDGRMEIFSDAQRMAYYDHREGWVVDDAMVGRLAQSIAPDTLYLPNVETAYIVLRDPETEEYRVTFQDRAITGNNLDLVIPPLGDDARFPVDVQVTLDDAYNVVEGEIAMDRSNNPYSLAANTGVPLELLRVRYGPEADGAYALTTDARLQLPPALHNIRTEFERLRLSERGLGLDELAVGAQTCEAEADPLASHTFANGDLTIRLQRVELRFVDQAYAFCGELTSTAFEAEGGEAVALRYEAAYANDAWQLDGQADHLPDLHIGTATFDPNNVGGLRFALADDELEVTLAGVLTVPDVFGSDFAVAIESLTLNSNDGVRFQAQGEGRMDAFDALGDVLRVEITEKTMAYADDVLTLDLDGRLWIKALMDVNNPDEAVQFEELIVRTNGEVSLARAGVNLITDDDPIYVLGDADAETLTVDDVQLAIERNILTLAMGGYARIGVPVGDAEHFDQPFRLTFDQNGNVDGDGQIVALFDEEGILGNNEDTEFELGDVATFDLQEVGIDLRNLAQPAVFANAAVFLNDDPEQAIRIGAPRQRGAEAGFYYALGGTPQWRGAAQLDEALELDVLNVRVTTATIEGNGRDFSLVFDGRAELAIEGVEGAMGWEGLTVDTDGISDFGQLSGEADFTIMDVVNLSIDEVDWGEGRFSADLNGDNRAETIQTTQYLRIAGAQLTLDRMMSGGVNEVVYYQERGSGNTYFRMLGANLNLGGHGDGFQLGASMIYQELSGDCDRSVLSEQACENLYGGGQGGFELLVAGSASVGGDEGMSISVAGAIRNTGNLAFGLYGQANIPGGIPIVPGIVSLTDIGGGFFYNAPSAWLEAVTDPAFLGFELYKPLPEVANLGFAVLLRGGASMLGGAMNVDALLIITDAYTKFDARGYIYTDGVFEAAMNLTVEYHENAKRVHGGVMVDVDFSPVLTGDARLDFYIADEDGDLLWAILGEANLDMLTLEGRGKLMLSNDGFLTEMRIEGGFDIKIVSVRSRFEASVWYWEGRSWGAYAELDVNASILGGVARIGAGLKGALINDAQEGFFLYAAAEAYVEVLFVFEGRVQVWVSLDDDGFDAGEGRNRKFDRLIARARQESETIGNQIEQTVAALDNAMGGLNSFGLSVAELRQAGYTLLMASEQDRAQFARAIMDNERTLIDAPDRGFPASAGGPGIWTDFQQRNLNQMDEIIDQLLLADDRPSTATVEQARTAMEDAIQEVSAQRDDINALLNDLQLEALESYEEAQSLDGLLQNPVQATWPAALSAGDGRMMSIADLESVGLSVDENLNAGNQDALTTLRESVAAMDAAYQEAITRVETNLDRLDQLISGRGNTSLNQYARQYYDAYTESQAFLARQGDYLWRMHEWAKAKRFANRFDTPNVLAASTDMLRYNQNGFSLGIGVAANRVEKLQLLASGCFEVASCPAGERQRVADEVARIRTRMTDWETDMRNRVRNAQFNFERAFRQTGADLWSGIYAYGFGAVIDTTHARIAALDDAYTNERRTLDRAYITFTDRIDQLYQTRANTAATLIAMVDEYHAWRFGLVNENNDNGPDNQPQNNNGGFPAFGGNAFGVAPVALNLAPNGLAMPYIALRTRLAEELTAPEITAISVQPSDIGYYGNTRITWNASHPRGVQEVSVNIEGGENENILGADDLKSVGSRRSVRHWSYAPTRGERSRSSMSQHNITVRVRGIGGVTATRRANFRVNYLDYLNGEPRRANQDGFSGNILADDRTPPQMLWLSLPDHSQGPNGPAGGEAWWGRRGDVLNVTLGAMDADSDIARYELALGTEPMRVEPRPGALTPPPPTISTDVLDWTTLHGERWANGGLQNAGIRASVRGLSLEVGQRYYVCARAWNGQGLVSRVYCLTNPIQLDVTPPTEPFDPLVALGQAGQRFGDAFGAGVGNILDRGQGDIPVYQPALAPPRAQRTPTTGAAVRAEHTVRWATSADPESGIAGYHVALHAQPIDAERAFEDIQRRIDTDDTEYTLRNRYRFADGSHITYGDSVHAYIRAYNHAGHFSPIVYRAGKLTDPTAPIPPRIQGVFRTGPKAIYFTRSAADAEAAIVGYQYAIGSAPGRSDIRSWPLADAIDVEQASLSESGIAYPKYLNAGVARALPQGQPFYVMVRALNAAGVYSPMVASGPFIVDDTEPTQGTLTVTLNGQPPAFSPRRPSRFDASLEIELSLLHDPESGIANVTYTVETLTKRGTYTTLIGPTSWFSFNPVVTPALRNLRRTIHLRPLSESDGLRITVTITNGYGLTRSYQVVRRYRQVPAFPLAVNPVIK